MQDLWLLSVKDLRWTATTTNGTGPSARHSMGFVGLAKGRILLFGGVDGKGMALDDLMLLDTLTAVWSTLEPSATKPSARYKMGIASTANNRVCGLGWRMHCGAEVTESSTNKQHHMSSEASCPDGTQERVGTRGVVTET